MNPWTLHMTLCKRDTQKKNKNKKKRVKKRPKTVPANLFRRPTGPRWSPRRHLHLHLQIQSHAGLANKSLFVYSCCQWSWSPVDTHTYRSSPHFVYCVKNYIINGSSSSSCSTNFWVLLISKIIVVCNWSFHHVVRIISPSQKKKYIQKKIFIYKKNVYIKVCIYKSTICFISPVVMSAPQFNFNFLSNNAQLPALAAAIPPRNPPAYPRDMPQLAYRSPARSYQSVRHSSARSSRRRSDRRSSSRSSRRRSDRRSSERSSRHAGQRSHQFPLGNVRLLDHRLFGPIPLARIRAGGAVVEPPVIAAQQARPYPAPVRRGGFRGGFSRQQLSRQQLNEESYRAFHFSRRNSSDSSFCNSGFSSASRRRNQAAAPPIQGAIPNVAPVAAVPVPEDNVAPIAAVPVPEDNVAPVAAVPVPEGNAVPAEVGISRNWLCSFTSEIRRKKGKIKEEPDFLISL